MANNQHELYDSNYSELLDLIRMFLFGIVNEEHEILSASSIVNYLIDVYTQSYDSEVLEILNTLGIDVNDTELNRIRNNSSIMTHARDNRRRLNDIFRSRVQELVELRESTDDKEFLERRALNIALLIATSELHMAVEQASVDAGKVISDTTGVTIYKVWNAVLDKDTCPYCERMHGVRIPVTGNFRSYAKSIGDLELYEALEYSGGETPYAHPRCRCWFTYET